MNKRRVEFRESMSEVGSPDNLSQTWHRPSLTAECAVLQAERCGAWQMFSDRLLG